MENSPASNIGEKDTPTPNLDPTPNNDGSSNDASSKQSTAASSIRGKSDPAWEYFSLKKDGKNNVYTCLFCLNCYKGGGINRMKQHLAGISGQIASCKKVPYDVRNRMQENLKEVQIKKKLDDVLEEFGGDGDGESTPATPITIIPPTTGKRKATSRVEKYFGPRTTSGAQPSLRSVFASKEAQNHAKMAFARWMYFSCVPFNAVNNPFFQEAVDAIAAMGPGFKGPTYHETRVDLLQACKKECQLVIDSHRSNWASTGCTLMADGWTDIRQRTLINFLVYSPTGIVFVKSVDASDLVKDAKTLFNLFHDVIQWVGHSNIVHVVTDNAANYQACGKLIHEKYKNIYWSPCAAHCLNLLLKDICNMPHIASLASRASKITIFVYNHIVFLSWLRNRDGWKEIVRPGPTRFATTFITLKSIVEHKCHLQALAVDQHFQGHKLSRTKPGKLFSEVVLDSKFWNDCTMIVRVVVPLIRLLRIVDSDEKPSLGYVYDGMLRAKNAVKGIFHNRKELYKPYTDLIKARWDKHLKNDLHAAAYFLNPAFFYGNDKDFRDHKRLWDAVLDLFDANYSGNQYTQMMIEVGKYRAKQESFGRAQASSISTEIQPDLWWQAYGGSAPLLQNLAVRLLSQTSSSSGCERNWSLFERIHTKKRNKLEHQRLNDLVYVNYNLRLQNRKIMKTRNYDPIDYESIENVETWITEEDASPDFDAEDVLHLENIASSSLHNEGGVDVMPELSPLVPSDASRFQHDAPSASHTPMPIPNLDSEGDDITNEGFDINDFNDI